MYIYTAVRQHTLCMMFLCNCIGNPILPDCLGPESVDKRPPTWPSPFQHIVYLIQPACHHLIQKSIVWQIPQSNEPKTQCLPEINNICPTKGAQVFTDSIKLALPWNNVTDMILNDNTQLFEGDRNLCNNSEDNWQMVFMRSHCTTKQSAYTILMLASQACINLFAERLNTRLPNFQSLFSIGRAWLTQLHANICHANICHTQECNSSPVQQWCQQSHSFIPAKCSWCMPAQ